MAENINKVVYGGRVLIDLTNDTIEASKLLKGYKAHDKSGAIVAGTCDFDANTQDANAAAGELLSGRSAYVRGVKVDGTMPNNEGVSGTISDVNAPYQIPAGYHDGSGKAEIDPTEKLKLIPDNIRQGITILGVTGEMSGTEDVKPQQKTVTPKTEQQTIVPDEGFNYLSQVVVEAIPYSESENSAGGFTATIGDTGVPATFKR